MVDIIARDSVAPGAVLLVDGYSSVSDPLVNRLGPRVLVISVDNDQAAKGEMEMVRHKRLVWFWRRTHDTSPNKFVSRLEAELAHGRAVQQHDYLPYSMSELWILRLLRGPGQPEYFYRLSEMRLIDASSSETESQQRGKR